MYSTQRKLGAHKRKRQHDLHYDDAAPPRKRCERRAPALPCDRETIAHNLDTRFNLKMSSVFAIYALKLSKRDFAIRHGSAERFAFNYNEVERERVVSNVKVYNLKVFVVVVCWHITSQPKKCQARAETKQRQQRAPIYIMFIIHSVRVEWSGIRSHIYTYIQI